MSSCKCDDPREKGMFQDVDVKIQVRTYLNFDVNVLKHAFFLWIITNVISINENVFSKVARKFIIFFKDIIDKFCSVLVIKQM